MRVQDVMTTDVIAISKFEGVMDVARTLSEKSISGLPVVDKDNRVIGIITQADILSVVGVRREHTVRDLLKHMLGEPLPERRTGDHVADIMTSPAMTVRPEENLAEAARILEGKKIRRLIVVDDGNRLVGIISRADILKAMIKKLQ